MFLLILEIEEGGWGRTLMWERNINWWPPVHTLMGDWTWNLGMCPDRESNCKVLVYGMTLQPTEPPGQGIYHIFFIHSSVNCRRLYWVVFSLMSLFCFLFAFVYCRFPPCRSHPIRQQIKSFFSFQLTFFLYLLLHWMVELLICL